MPANSLQDLYQNKLQLILDAEQQALQAYPQIMEAAQHQELRQSLQRHMQQTQQQVEQLQPLTMQGNGGAQGEQRCQSMTALIDEARQMLGQIQDADTRDAFIIGAAQAMEHHEIASYGTAKAWAQELGRDEDVQVLDRILSQEKETDQLLTQLAERQVNEQAAQSDREVPMSSGSELGTQGGSGGGAQTGFGFGDRPEVGA